MFSIGSRAGRVMLSSGLFAAMLAVLILTFPASEPRAAAVPAPAPPKAAQPPAVAPPVEPEAPAAPSEPAFAVKRILDLGGPLRHGDYAWDDKGVPAGPLIITIDLAAETLSVFRGGYEIGVAAILFGATDKETPLGAFSITEKDADHVSNLYDAPMPYMLRLTNDGVSIHGSEVEWGAATHGCIGVPVEFAKLLFGQARLGDRVIITRGKMLDVGGQLIAS
jgi:lipoprotein-anchoring transpeptidase ErfK/SrfK